MICDVCGRCDRFRLLLVLGAAVALATRADGGDIGFVLDISSQGDKTLATCFAKAADHGASGVMLSLDRGSGEAQELVDEAASLARHERLELWLRVEAPWDAAEWARRIRAVYYAAHIETQLDPIGFDLVDHLRSGSRFSAQRDGNCG